MTLNIVSVIPARKGSASIVDKNIRNFCGKPLISWSISQSLSSRYVSRTIVSTDSPEYQEIAVSYGSESPFLRSKQFATASSSIEPVLREVYEYLNSAEGYQVDIFALLFPTSPFRPMLMIDSCIDYYLRNQLNTLITVEESPAHATPYWTLLQEDDHVTYFDGSPLSDGICRRQDFPCQCFMKNDLLFLIDPKSLFSDKPSIYGGKTKLFDMSGHIAIDINSDRDFYLAEQLFKLSPYSVL